MAKYQVWFGVVAKGRPADEMIEVDTFQEAEKLFSDHRKGKTVNDGSKLDFITLEMKKIVKQARSRRFKCFPLSADVIG